MGVQVSTGCDTCGITTRHVLIDDIEICCRCHPALDDGRKLSKPNRGPYRLAPKRESTPTEVTISVEEYEYLKRADELLDLCDKADWCEIDPTSGGWRIYIVGQGDDLLLFERTFVGASLRKALERAFRLPPHKEPEPAHKKGPRFVHRLSWFLLVNLGILVPAVFVLLLFLGG